MDPTRACGHEVRRTGRENMQKKTEEKTKKFKKKEEKKRGLFQKTVQKYTLLYTCFFDGSGFLTIEITLGFVSRNVLYRA